MWLFGFLSNLVVSFFGVLCYVHSAIGNRFCPFLFWRYGLVVLIILEVGFFVSYISRSIFIGPSTHMRGFPVDYCNLHLILQHCSYVYQHRTTKILSKFEWSWAPSSTSYRKKMSWKPINSVMAHQCTTKVTNLFPINNNTLKLPYENLIPWTWAPS